MLRRLTLAQVMLHGLMVRSRPAWCSLANCDRIYLVFPSLFLRTHASRSRRSGCVRLRAATSICG